MPPKGYKTITINQRTFDRMGLSSHLVTTELYLRLQEQADLQSLASKVTVVPETVRVYGPFSVKKERGEREKP